MMIKSTLDIRRFPSCWWLLLIPTRTTNVQMTRGIRALSTSILERQQQQLQQPQEQKQQLRRLAQRIRTRFILTHTHHVGNVGGVARAIKTMGFEELVLVSPHDPKVLNRQRTREFASGAMNVLRGAKIVSTLSEALDGTKLWCGTGMPCDMSNSRSFLSQDRFEEPRPFFQQLITQQLRRLEDSAIATTATTTSSSTTKQHHDNMDLSSISFVFGNETTGMTREDIELCHVILGIPTNPQFGSLNLASAVQLIAYDWRQELGGFSSSVT